MKKKKGRYVLLAGCLLTSAFAAGAMVACKEPTPNPNPNPDPIVTEKDVTITIKYVYEDGSQAAESVTKTVKEGSKFEFESPKVDGFVADKATVSGTASENATFVVTYTKRESSDIEVEDVVVEGDIAEAYKVPALAYALEKGVSFSFLAGGTNADDSWGSLVNAGGYVLTYGNLDSWTVDQHNCYPAISSFGGVWDILLYEGESYLTVSVDKTGIRFYKDGALVLAYAPTDRMNGTPSKTVADFIDGFLGAVQENGATVGEKLYSMKDIRVTASMNDGEALLSYLDYMGKTSYLVNIVHVDAEGKEVAPTQQKIFEIGAGEVTFEALDLLGYRAQAEKIVQTIEGNCEIKFVYDKVNVYSVSIDYVYEDGSKAAEPSVYSVNEGEPVEFNAPCIYGYKPDVEVISSESVNEDLAYTITYREDETQRAIDAIYGSVAKGTHIDATEEITKDTGLFVSFTLAGAQKENGWGSLLNAGGYKITYGNLDAWPERPFNLYPDASRFGGNNATLKNKEEAKYLINITESGIVIYKNGTIALKYVANEPLRSFPEYGGYMTVGEFIDAFLSAVETDGFTFAEVAYEMSDLKYGPGLTEAQCVQFGSDEAGIESYRLVIHYVDGEGNPIYADYDKQIKKGHQIHIVYPDSEDSGYIPREISGDFEITQDIEYTVVYDAAPVYTITVKEYLGGELIGTKTKRITKGRTYEFPVDVKVGYTVDRDTISGTVTGDETFEVHYTEDRYQLATEIIEGAFTTRTFAASNEITAETGMSISFFMNDTLGVSDWSSLVEAAGFKIALGNLDPFPTVLFNAWPALTAFGGANWNAMLTGVEAYYTVNVTQDSIDFYKNGVVLIRYDKDDNMNALEGGSMKVGNFIDRFLSGVENSGARVNLNGTMTDLRYGVGMTENEVLMTYYRAIGQDAYTISVVTKVDGVVESKSEYILADGASYSYDFTARPGYALSATNISGTATEDKEIVVDYTLEHYTVTIRYEDSDGNQLFDDVVLTDLVYGDLYSQASPEHATLTPDLPTVEGTATETKVITVTYYTAPNAFKAYLDGNLYKEEDLVPGADLGLPVCPDAGYEYKWYTDSSKTTEFTADRMPDADTTIYGFKTAIEYTATFVADGQTVQAIDFTVETMGSVVAPTVPARGDNVVGAWEEYTLGTANITVNAIYKVQLNQTIATSVINGFNVWTGTENFEVPKGNYEANVSFDFTSNTGLAQGWDTWGLQVGHWVLRGDKYSWWGENNSGITNIYTDISGTFINPAQGHAEIRIVRIGTETTVTITVTSDTDSYTYKAVNDVGDGLLGIGFGGEDVTLTNYTRTVSYDANKDLSAYTPSCYSVNVGAGDFTMKYKFHQVSSISGNLYYKSWCVTISPEWILRSDYYSNEGNAGTVYGPYVNWEDYVSVYRDATVEVTISRVGDVISVTATATGANGMTIEYSATKTLNANAMTISLGAEGCTLDMLAIEQ